MKTGRYRTSKSYFQQSQVAGFLSLERLFLPAMPALAERLTKKPSKRLDPLTSDLSSYTVRMRRATRLTDDQLFQFCQDNAELRIEQAANGDLIIMAPVGSEGGHRNFNLYIPFGIWHEKTKLVKFFDATSGFRLPNKAMRSPDAAWVRQEKIDKLTQKEWQTFAPVCPDFVVELRSRTDRLPAFQEKMAEYLANGAQLGWLVDPLEKQVFVYRPGQPVEHLSSRTTLSGEPVLPGFTLDLARVW